MTRHYNLNNIIRLEQYKFHVIITIITTLEASGELKLSIIIINFALHNAADMEHYKIFLSTQKKIIIKN